MLVTSTDLRTYMDVTLSNRQLDAADIVLAGLQSELEAFLNRPIEVGTFTNETHVFPATHVGIPLTSFFYNQSLDSTSAAGTVTYSEPPTTIYLRNSPVVTVSNVTLFPVQSNSQVLVVDQDYTVRRYGVDVYRGFANDVIKVTYTAGLVGANIKMFKLMILRAATREMQNMHDDVVGVKDLNPRNVAIAETGFTDKELIMLKRYKRHRIS